MSKFNYSKALLSIKTQRAVLAQLDTVLLQRNGGQHEVRGSAQTGLTKIDKKISHIVEVISAVGNSAALLVRVMSRSTI